MDSKLHTLSASDLRTLMLHQAKKFIQALERGTPIHDLEAIRTYMKEIGDVLLVKEKEESAKGMK